MTWPRCATGCPTLPSATCMSAARRHGPRTCAGPPRQPVCRPTGSTSRASGGDEVKRIVLWAMTTLTVLVLLFGYHTSTSSEPSPGTVLAAPGAGTGSSASSGGGTSTDGSPSTDGGTGSAQGGTPSGTTKTVTGPAAATRWGPVQVEITVDGGRLTNVTVVEYPNGNGRDRQINARALPALVQETIDAQSADIDMVSGATVTSEGYLTSLQAALDGAGL